MKRILRLVLIITILLGLVACGGGGNKTGNKTNPVASNLEENITIIDSGTSEYGELVFVLRNGNDMVLDVDIVVEFYDADKNPIGNDTATMYAVPYNAEAALAVDTPEGYDSYDYYFKIDENPLFTSYYNEVEMTDNNNGKEIIVQVKNTTEVQIDDIHVSVVFYRNGKIVGYDSTTDLDVPAGRNGNFTLYFPRDNNWKEVEFDDYKVFLNSALCY